MWHRPSSLTTALVATVLIAAVFLLRLNHLPVEVLVAVPFVLFLPGYALSYALFGRGTFGAVERALVSVAASIALAIVTGVLLNVMPWGLDANTWLFALAGLTLALGVFALTRGNAPLTTSMRRPRLSLRAGDAVFYGAALVVLISAIQVARMPAPADRVDGYTALWLVPAQMSNPDTLNLGISSSELQTTRYRVELRKADQVVQEWDDIVLDPGASWTQTIHADISRRSPESVQALLYRADQPGTVYRHVQFEP